VLERAAFVQVLGRKGTAVRCLGQQGLGSGEVLARPWYEGHEVIIAFAGLSERLQRVG
jgi:hypothetical protein